MGMRRGLGTLTLILALSGCFAPPSPVPAPPAPQPTTAAPDLTEPRHPVGRRVLRLSRGPERPLRTLLFYPDAAGLFPLVVFSHGLRGSPESFATALRSWAAAGFVVAAPTFPYTNVDARPYRKRDILHQPDDLRHVLAELRRLARAPHDPLRGRIDTDRIAAIGHSAGGYTTSGLFVAGHDPRLRAGLIMAGWQAPGTFAGPPATMLFLQGTADPIVPPARSRAAYDNVPWPKAYVLMPGISHANYLHPGDLGYAQVESVALDFLRWTLKADAAAGRRLPHSDKITAEP